MIKDGWKKEGVKWYCAPVQPHNLVKQAERGNEVHLDT